MKALLKGAAFVLLVLGVWAMAAPRAHADLETYLGVRLEDKLAHALKRYAGTCWVVDEDGYIYTGGSQVGRTSEYHCDVYEESDDEYYVVVYEKSHRRLRELIELAKEKSTSIFNKTPPKIKQTVVWDSSLKT